MAGMDFKTKRVKLAKIIDVIESSPSRLADDTN